MKRISFSTQYSSTVTQRVKKTGNQKSAIEIKTDEQVSELECSIRSLPESFINTFSKTYDSLFDSDTQKFINYIGSQVLHHKVLSTLIGGGVSPLLAVLLASYLPKAQALNHTLQYFPGIPANYTTACLGIPKHYSTCEEFYALTTMQGSNENVTSSRVIQFARTFAQKLDIGCISGRTPASCDSNNKLSYKQDPCNKPMTNNWFSDCMSADKLFLDINQSVSSETNSSLVNINRICPIDHVSGIDSDKFAVRASLKGVSFIECDEFRTLFNRRAEQCNSNYIPPAPSSASPLYGLGYFAFSTVLVGIVKRLIDSFLDDLDSKSTKSQKLKTD